jgi:hypothetical protein
MAFTADGPNLLWSNPKLEDQELVRHRSQELVGGLGGDRLWFAPELEYYWNGSPDWDTFLNYQVPTAADPGAYDFFDAGRQAVSLRADIELRPHLTDHRVGFSVERTVRMTPAPLAPDHRLMREVEYVGIETSHRARFDQRTTSGRIDLWHLLQVPAGALLIVPLKASASSQEKTPLSYARPGAWIQQSDCVLWRYGGEARAKLGLPANALTGRTAVLRDLAPGYQCLIVREFAVDAVSTYADHPHGIPRADQAFQAWDGFGFGEMEYHSPMLDAQSGPRELRESDRLWAFGGREALIRALAMELLGVDYAWQGRASSG